MARVPAPASTPHEGQVEAAFKPTPIALLVQLLVSLFPEAANMRTFVRSYSAMEKVDIDLPADLVSAITMADALVVRLRAEGLVGPRFFASLVKERPFREAEIREVEAVWSSPGRSRLEEPRDRNKLFTLPKIAALLAAALTILGSAPFILEPEHVDFETDDSSKKVPLLITSTTTGKSWTVPVSIHQAAQDVARKAFMTLHLKGYAEIGELFQSGKYELCQGDVCYSLESIGDLDLTEPASVAFDGRSLLSRITYPEMPPPPTPRDRHFVQMQLFLQAIDESGKEPLPDP